MLFSRNDIVKFNPEFCTDTEKDRLYIVLESYDDVRRAKVSPVECSLPIVPVESVSYEMIKMLRNRNIFIFLIEKAVRKNSFVVFAVFLVTFCDFGCCGNKREPAET